MLGKSYFLFFFLLEDEQKISVGMWFCTRIAHFVLHMSHFLHLFLNETLLFIVFSCLVVCSVINEENREIDRFIQLNPNNSKDQANQGNHFKSKGYLNYLIWKLDISDKIISSNFKRKMDCLKTLSVSLKINGYLINSRRQIENSGEQMDREKINRWDEAI